MESNAIQKAKIVASNIRKVREFRNYTQLYMAEKLGVSQNAYSKIELGYSKICLEKLFLIAEALAVENIAILLNCDEHILCLRSDISF